MTRAGRIAAAVVGLLVAAGYLCILVYLLSGNIVVDADVTIFCFLVCGVAAAIGLMFVYRLLPRRDPIVLFTGSGVVPIQHPPATETLAVVEKRATAGTQPAKRAHRDAEIAPVMKSHGSESAATYTTHEDVGVAALATMIGTAFILGGRFDFGRLFLALAVLAGGAMALGLNWLRIRRENSGIVSYTLPVAGGIICLLCMIGLGLVMARFRFLRYFLGVAIAGGGAVALLLSWRRARESSRPFRVAP